MEELQIEMNSSKTKRNITLRALILNSQLGRSFLKLGHSMQSLPTAGIRAGAKHTALIEPWISMQTILC